ARGGDRLNGGVGNVESLSMHCVPRQILRLDRLKRSGADMQRDVHQGDTALSQTLEQLVVEMKPRGRRGDCAGMPRVDGLVALDVELVGRSRYVRGQRDFAVL